MLVKVICRTPSGDTYNGIFQLEATFIDVQKDVSLHDLNKDLWNTDPTPRPLS